jgi:hypothetical protein
LYRFDLEEKTYTLVTELGNLQNSYIDENLEPPTSKYFYKVERADKNAELDTAKPIRVKREEVMEQISSSSVISNEEEQVSQGPIPQAPPPQNAGTAYPTRGTAPARATTRYPVGNEGIYVGIVSFSGKVTDITQRSDGAPTLIPLDAPGRQVLLEYLSRSYIPSKSSGTALYYADHKALANLTIMEKEGSLPSNLSSVTLITFTDGTDTSSTDVEFTPIESRDFRRSGTGTSYRNYISQQISTRRIAGININSWAIGVRGRDVDGNAEFSQTLEAIASKPGNVAEFSFVSQMDDRLTAIANGLNTYTPRTNLTFSTPAYPVNTLVRLTFDGDINFPDSSEYYVDVRVNWDDLNKNYFLMVAGSYGVTVSGSRRLDAKRDETGINYTLTLDNDFVETGVRQWYIQPGEDAFGWLRNSECQTEKAADFTHERKSAIVYLVLDCSSSLTEKEIHDIRAAMSAFINNLYEISSSKIELETVGYNYPEPRMVESTATRQTTAQQRPTAPVAPGYSQQGSTQGSASTTSSVTRVQTQETPPSPLQFSRQEPLVQQSTRPAYVSPPTQTSQPAVSRPSAQPTLPTTSQTPTRTSQSTSSSSPTRTTSSGTTASNPSFYWVQIGSYTDAARAHRAWSAFGNIGLGRAEILSSNVNGTIHYRVKAGPYVDKTTAEDTLARIKAYSVEYRNSYLTNE